VVTHQLQVERRTAKAHRPKIDALPLDHVANYARAISLNAHAHYFVLFKNPWDANQFATLARQMYPNSSKFAVEAYVDATTVLYGYLLIDLTPDHHSMNDIV